MMHKDQWIAEHERILDEYAGGEIDRELAEACLKDIGMYPPEIKTYLDRETVDG